MALSADIEAGRAFITLYLRSGAFKDNVEALGRKLTHFSQRIRSSAMQMATSAIILATPFVAATKVFADFSRQMAFVATMLDVPQQHMKRFSAGVRELSVEFGESTQTLSKGLYDILSAGFDAEKAMEMLRVTTIAAKAGMADAASATSAIIAVLNAYGLGAEHAQKVSDVLFTTVRYGVLTFGELAGHIGLVASTAAQAHVSMEDLGAVLAIITRGGVETSHAVVALNNILKAFLMPTGAGADFAVKLKEAGLDFEMSVKSLRELGLVGAFARIANLPTEALARLFPTIRAGRGVFAMKAGWQSLLEVVEKFKDVTNATDRAMDEIRKSFGFLVDRVKQGGALILSYVGEALAESLTNVGEKVINLAIGFGAVIQQNKDYVIGIVKMIATLGELALVMLVVAKAAAVLGVILTVAAGPHAIAIMVTSILAAVAAWALLSKAMSAVSQELSDIVQTGKDIRGPGGEKVTSPTTRYSQVAKELQRQIKLHTKLTNKINATRDAIRILEGMGASDSRDLTTMAKGGRPGEKGEYPIRYSVEKAILRSIEEQRNKRAKQIEVLTAQHKRLKTIHDWEQKRLKIQEAQAAALQKQSNLMRQITGIGRLGYFAGYFHTPIVEFASSGGTSGGEQIDLLKSIRDGIGGGAPNTKAGSVIEAIETAAQTT